MAGYEYLDENRLRVGRAEMLVDWLARGGSVDDLVIMKPPALIEQMARTLAEVEPRTIVELGIHRGGSVAAIAELAQPDCHIAFELADGRVQALDAYIADTGSEDRIHLEYGVDQGDTLRVAALTDEHRGPAPIDLVFDDASHLYGPTKASFEALYPRMRPGGRFIIEDWAWTDSLATAMTQSFSELDADARASRAATVADDLRALADEREDTRLADAADALRAEPTTDNLVRAARARAPFAEAPLSALGIELLLAVAEVPDIVAQVTITPDWIDIVRGSADIDHSFRLADVLADHGAVIPLPRNGR
ncbi:MAG: hypothetical protein DHS20C19_04610 [Acidimicrobiales bacterium]|nr:MAG: hypothetical protein DHS20C19_04610 [Acidimicrobiales bacterium]